MSDSLYGILETAFLQTTDGYQNTIQTINFDDELGFIYNYQISNCKLDISAFEGSGGDGYGKVFQYGFGVKSIAANPLQFIDNDVPVPLVIKEDFGIPSDPAWTVVLSIPSDHNLQIDVIGEEGKTIFWRSVFRAETAVNYGG